MIAATAGLVARYAVAYFASVFSIGVLLGIVRTLWIAPWLGERVAETPRNARDGRGELPRCARADEPRWCRRNSRCRARRVAALALLLCAELAVFAFARGQTLADYVASRDPVSGSAYVLALLLFAAMPAAISYRRTLR